jgi:hypothetical protein
MTIRNINSAVTSGKSIRPVILPRIGLIDNEANAIAKRRSEQIGVLIRKTIGKKYHHPFVRTSPRNNAACPSLLWRTVEAIPVK